MSSHHENVNAIIYILIFESSPKVFRLKCGVNLLRSLNQDSQIPA